MLNDWVVQAKKFVEDKNGDKWCVDKRVYTRLEGEEARDLHRELYTQSYWSEIKTFTERSK